MKEERLRTLKEMQHLLEALLSRQQDITTEVHTLIPELKALAAQMKQLVQNTNEMNRLTQDLSQGKLNGPIPSKGNHMAGPLKQLHSQLSTFTWGLKQMQKRVYCQ